MLEAIRERAQGWIARIILGLIVLSFAIWGVDWYFKGGGKEASVATVGSAEISQRDFNEALKQQREALGIKPDQAGDLEKTLRKQVLDQLVNVSLLTNAAISNGFAMSEAQTKAFLAGIEIFQDKGQFSQQRLEAFLRNRGLSEQRFMDMVRQDMLLRQLQFAYGEGALVPASGAERFAKLLAQQREVSEISYNRQQFLNLVQIDDKAVEQEYNAHKQDYAVPPQVRLQYVVLSMDAIKSQLQVTEATARQHYEANKARYQEPESRRASHILIKTDKAMDDKARQASKAQAEKVLQEVQKNPARFAELAKQHSADPISAARGGDLGSFTRDMMVKPFADAVFQMKTGEIRGLVETDFGYHIIRLDGITAGRQIAFETVRDEIVQELQTQEATRKFAEVAERFSNLVYEQPESLDPAAKEFKLKVEESGWIARGQAQPAFLGNPRLLDAVFAEEALNKHQNTEAIEVAPNMLVAARVLEHRPASTRPLAEVAGEIRLKLTVQEAAKKAVEAGKQALDAARNGTVPSGLSAPMSISRMRSLNLPPAAVKAIFKADAAKLPAWVGVETAEGYRLYRITGVSDEALPPEQALLIRRDLQRLTAQEELRVYLDSLKGRTEIKISQGILEQKAE